MRGASHPSDRGDVTRLAVVAFAIAGIVLLVACANVAALLLGRSTMRAREIGIRLALGAGRARVVRQLLIESLVVAVVAGLLALMLSWWTIGAVVAWLDVPLTLDVSPDLVSLMATLGVSAMAAVAFGLVPALHATRGGIAASALAGGNVAGATPGRARLQRLSAISQIALSLALLAAAGVLLRGVALLLAAIGVYGLVSWRTARRQREIGVRMALGATRLDVLRLVASDGARVAAAGSIAGLVLGVAAARLIAGVSGGSPAADVPMLLAVTALVWLVAFAASCLPAPPRHARQPGRGVARGVAVGVALRSGRAPLRGASLGSGAASHEPEP